MFSYKTKYYGTNERQGEGAGTKMSKKVLAFKDTKKQ